MDEPVLLSPGEGEAIRETLLIKTGRPEFVVTESRYEPGAHGPDPHIHRHHVDAFWILAGRLAFPLGPDGHEVEAGAGSFVLVPPNVVHTFRNDGPADATWLNFHAPSAGFASFLRDSTYAWDSFDAPEDGGAPLEEATVDNVHPA